jgi:hypothetical protein
MNKQELLQLVTPAKADAFSDMVISIVETIADAMLAVGQPLSAIAVLQHLETQCRSLRSDSADICARIATIQGYNASYYTKLVATLMPTLFASTAEATA